MKISLLFLLLLSSTLLAQDGTQATPSPTEIKTVGPVRYQLCVVGNGAMPMVVKIDTATGNAWVMQMTPDTVRAQGTPFVWTFVPNVNPH